ncbi:MAG: DNA polymerase III subunit alpha [Malacoplasma sp.]|nr:DNA polymerase III subunit alpha [Malacoplasma sp.]
MKDKQNSLLALNLLTSSCYSLLDSTLSIDKIINFAFENKKEYVCLADNNLFGALEFYTKCQKNNLKPVLGLKVEAYFDTISQLKKECCFYVFAKNYLGYLNLIKISSFLETNTFFNLKDYLNNVFLVCYQKPFVIADFEDVWFIDDENENQTIAANVAKYDLAKNKRIYNALVAIKENKTINNILQLESGNDYYLLNEKEALEKFSNSAINNLNNLISQVDLKIEFQKNNIIQFPHSDKITSKNLLYQLCVEGLNNKIFANQIDVKQKDIYLQRIEKELEVIDKMGFNDYFLVVQDFINDAKNKGILIGPGRGSAAGCLVAYLLNITTIDSIKYNLVFERFLNPGRTSMPDIDVDIMDNRRNEVVDYLFEKYGYDRVAHIITFQRMKAKMAIRDVGRILQIDLKVINSICKNLDTQYDENLKASFSDPKIKDSYSIYKDLFEIASELIMIPRQTGIHAAGIVLSQKPLTDIVPIQSSVNNEITTQYSMEYLEELGLIKMDLLGLTNLKTIANICSLVKKTYDFDIDLLNINLEDASVFLDLQKGHTLGIFQLESYGMNSVIRQVKPKCIEDISLCSALYRPGPMQNIKTFVARRNQTEKIEYIDLKNKAILAPTYGIIVYQEQVIKLVQNIANFSASEADLFRRIIAKKHSNELENFKKLFFEKAIQNGYQIQELNKIYEYIYTFADYGFNHSHSVAYALISYWMLYLKHYYPIEFMLVLMTCTDSDKNKINSYLTECKRLKINVLKPNINLSNKSFALYQKNAIMFGLCSIKGIGVETSKKIIEIRSKLKHQKFSDFVEAIKLLTFFKIGKSTIQTLIYAGAFDCFNTNKKYILENLDEIINTSQNLKKDYSFVFQPILKNVTPLTNEEIQKFNQLEIETLGVDLNRKTNTWSKSWKKQY